MEKYSVVCPRCGVEACQQLMFELSYYTLSLHDKDFVHQLAVDAYAARHSGNQTKPISTTFALVGLYLVNERNFTGKQVQQAHMTLAKKRRVWPNFSVPESKTWMTVRDVLQDPDDKKKETIKEWNKSVWNVWKTEREKVAALVKEYLFGFRG